MYTLKSIARRGTSFAAAMALVVSSVGSAVIPAMSAYADSLNPLTERSLTLSSSSPGWANTDGSGNSTYAPPNSGANGQKSGNYFGFKVSTDSSVDADTSGAPDNPIKAMSFQYCRDSAGACAAPGDNAAGGGFDHGGPDTATTSDLNVNYPSAAEVDNADFGTVIDTSSDPATRGNVKAVPGYTNNNPKYQAQGGTGDPAEAAKNVAGNFIVMYFDPAANTGAGGWVQSTGWTATTSNQEEATSGTSGKQNTIILQNAAGLGLPSAAQVKVLFFATATNYITNPGSGYFFVKINTFKNFQALAGPTPGPENTLKDNIDRLPTDVIDGGVTVANVMNQSIQITTKVLETMEFSVGTVDPNTLNPTELAASENKTGGTHGTCNTILTRLTSSDPQNVLQLGKVSAENSLETDNTYATHSYWRLSSNSSAGATVYYSGHTLSNTSGDEIKPIGTTAKTSAPGAEQFGLAMATKAVTGADTGGTWDDSTHGVDYTTAGTALENAADTYIAGASNGDIQVDDSLLTDLGAVNTPPWDYTNLNESYHSPRLDPLAPTGNSGTGLNYYGGGSGTIGTGGTAKFAFDAMSDTVPAPIASENSQVVDCVTAKMRYIANIAATTPAGIYTTKINYIAAPQY